MTTRESILTRIQTILQAVTGVEEVYIDKTTLISIDSVPMSTCFIYAGPEARAKDDRQVLQKETWVWVIQIELWSYIEDIETVLGAIHQAMYDDRTLTGLAVNSYRVGADSRYFDLDGTRKAMLIPYEVIYRHPLGTM
jgi:hypothetical protein